jgi:hypothetical protein
VSAAAPVPVIRRGSILVAGGALLVGLLWFVSPATAAPFDIDGLFLLFLDDTGIGELLLVDTPRGKPVPASMAVLAAFALLGNPPWELALVAGAAWLVAAGIRGILGDRSDPLDLAHRVFAAWSLPGLVAVGTVAVPGLLIGSRDGTGVQISLAAIVLITGGLVVGPGLWEAARSQDAFVRRAQALIRDGLPPALALGSSAALAAVCYGLLGGWGLLILLLPVLAARAGLHKFVDIRRTYDQTIVAMSRMTELTGHVPDGHGIRVGQLSAAMARRLGLSEDDVHMVERAAHLHEVGRIATDDPENRAHDHEVARAGAAIVREAGDMPEVAEMIERLRDPYRTPGAQGDSGVPTGARIIRTACEYDRFVSDGAEMWEALDSLHRLMAYDHDPVVVNALARVVERDPART